MLILLAWMNVSRIVHHINNIYLELNGRIAGIRIVPWYLTNVKKYKVLLFLKSKLIFNNILIPRTKSQCLLKIADISKTNLYTILTLKVEEFSNVT